LASLSGTQDGQNICCDLEVMMDRALFPVILILRFRFGVNDVFPPLENCASLVGGLVLKDCSETSACYRHSALRNMPEQATISFVL